MQSPIETLRDEPAQAGAPAPALDLSNLPPVYILETHLETEELRQTRKHLDASQATLTSDASEAKLILGAINSVRRAKFDLQVLGLRIFEDEWAELSKTRIADQASPETPESKRRRIARSRSTSPSSEDAHAGERPDSVQSRDGSRSPAFCSQASALALKEPSKTASKSKTLKPEDEMCLERLRNGPDRILILKLDWFAESLASGQIQPFHPSLIFEGRREVLPEVLLEEPAASPGIQRVKIEIGPQNDLQNLTTKTQTAPRASPNGKTFQSRPFGGSRKRFAANRKTPTLMRETTAEHEAQPENRLDLPQWVKENKIFSCERPTLEHSPNDGFIAQLKKIKLGRTLNLDEIGVRAYSTSIASIAAFPRELSSAQEVLALPGCDQKIAHLFRRYQETGRIEEADEVDNNPDLKVIRSFYDIWGVGAKTAREFYFDRKFQNTDDIIEHGWNLLTRVQQIGLKYHDEFEQKMSRSEVEYIASIVTYHAKQAVDDDIECVIVGGYRRGKPESGDADIIISHRRESATLYLIRPLIDRLLAAGWITHTLSVTETNSAREQATLPLRAPGVRGSGFDTLDKGLVVWQDTIWPGRATDLAADPGAKNPNPHRRVDIIVSPWRTVGCAVTGWTSGTTFQRDLRRYAKHTKGWKFDSSGVRDRASGRWIDLEKWSDERTRAKTWEEAERRVFEGLGLAWRDPRERCTG